jgi:mono/diheme cytochrome c family protein
MNFLRTCLRPFLLYGTAGMLLFVFLQGVDPAPPFDHASVIKSLDASTLSKGKEIYQKACAICHGNDGVSSLPQARSFTKDPMRFGNKPYDMWKTITNGAGIMPAQSWLTPQERYYVIQYIRESFILPSNKKQYFQITDAYLASLPKPSVSSADQAVLVKTEAKKGSLQYGQEWFKNSASDYGPAIYSQLQDHSTSVLSVQLGKDLFLSYDLLRLRSDAAWTGSLNLSKTKYKLYRGEGQPFIDGKLPDGLQTWEWQYSAENESVLRQTGKRAVPPPSVFQYDGHYLHAGRVILSYSVEGRKVLEMPRGTKDSSGTALVHKLTIGPGAARTLVIGSLKDSMGVMAGTAKPDGTFQEGQPGVPGERPVVLIGKSTKPEPKYFVASVPSSRGLTWSVSPDNRVLLTIPASEAEMTLTITRKAGTCTKALANLQGYVSSPKGADSSLSSLIRNPPAAVVRRQTVKGFTSAARPHFDSRYYKDKDKTSASKLVNIPADYPYTVDQITLPYDNPHNAWIRPTTLAFRPDGGLYVGTYLGDVWLATGIDSALRKITWQRIATGLYEPMGMKVINNKLLVTCRNGIMRLHDNNRDEQIDFYEQMYADHDVSNFFHAFNFGLETDSKGNLYYVKPGQFTDNKDPGNVMKVSPDGKTAETIATGFRVNNGITVSPNDLIFVSDNQGSWTPANKINVIEQGKYYGYVPNFATPRWSPDGQTFPKEKVKDAIISSDLVKVPDTFAQPALWMPQEFDNSPGGGTWSSKTWGPLGNSFIHTSYGTGWCYYVLPKNPGGVWQASMIALPFQFDAGIQRAAVNPVDGNIYVTGLTGWDDGVAQTYGTLARIRYAGGEGHLVKDVEIIPSGIRLAFNFTLDPAALDTADAEVSMWNYKWTSNYGSAHYSVLNPGKEGEDRLSISQMTASGKILDIKVPALQQANTVRLRLWVKATDGTIMNESIYLTINKMPLP